MPKGVGQLQEEGRIREVCKKEGREQAGQRGELCYERGKGRVWKRNSRESVGPRSCSMSGKAVVRLLKGGKKVGNVSLERG